MRNTFTGLLLAAAICTTSTTWAFSTPKIFERACANSGFSQCSQAGLPAGFCCGAGSTCIALAGNTTVLCCPAKESCSTIQSIPCDVQLQNNTAHPDNSLKTTALTGTLPTCGNLCCPFGFTCADPQAGVCAMSKDQSQSPATSSTSSSAPTSSKPASTSTGASSTATTTPTISNVPSQNTTVPLPVANCNKFPTGAVLAGLFPGIALGILLSIAGICLLGARRRKQEKRNSNGSFGNISDPQPNNADMRTDFLRKQPMTPSTLQSNGSPRRQNTVSRMKSMFRKSGSNPVGLGQRTMPGGGNAPPVPKPMTTHPNRPFTPPLQREPSYENINIFTDNDTASALREASREGEQINASGGLGIQSNDTRASRQTTFSDMMQQSGLAGLQKGQPYIYRGNSTQYPTPSPQRTRTP